VIVKRPSTERNRKMKTRIIAVTVMIALIGTMWVPKAHAGDKEWATAGKILTGIAALSFLGAVSESHHDDHYYYNDHRRPYRHHRGYRRVYRAEPVYYETTVHRYEAPRPRIENKLWMQGHYVTENVRIWVPGEKIKTWIEPRYEKVWVGNDQDGHWEEVIAADGYWTYEYRKGHYGMQTNRRWVAGYWRNI
jgi:hypothetical protein